MKRVLLNSSGLYVSKSGFDVTTATPAELSLDTATSKVFSIFLQGSIAYSAFTTTSNTTSGGEHIIQADYTLSFGRTFAAPPIILLTQQDPILSTSGNPAVNQAYANFDAEVLYGGSGFASGAGGGSVLYYTVTTTTLTLKFYWVAITYSPPNPVFINYSVLRTS